MSSRWFVKSFIFDLGLDWTYIQRERIMLLSTRCHRQSMFSLHLEMEVLLWVISIILEKRIFCQIFETDCSQLVNITKFLEKWLTFANLLYEFDVLSARISNFSLSLIFHSLNLKQHVLACSVHVRFYGIVCKLFFFRLINQSRSFF